MLSVGRGGRTLGQRTKHVRTHTHKLKPLNHLTVVPQPLSPLRFNTEPVFSRRDDIGDLPRFDTPCLRRVFTNACTANGAGLGRQQTNDFYAVLRAVERDAGGDEALAERFPSKTAF